MARPLVCDLCGGPALGEVSLSVHLESAVPGTRGTGARTEAKDACEACWGATLDALYEGLRDRILHDVQIHREHDLVKAELDAANEARQRAVEMRDEVRSQVPRTAPTEEHPQEVREAYAEAASALHAAQRMVDAHDERVAAIRARRMAVLERAR